MSKIVVCDIDGTISKVGDRIKYLEQSPKDWDAFYDACEEDKPIENVLRLIESITWEGLYIPVFCTGRRESCRKDTTQWLEDYACCLAFADESGRLIMRKDDDFRSDTIVKKELLDNYLSDNGYTKDDVAFILEDRSSVVKMWRDAGYTCLQVAEGDF